MILRLSLDPFFKNAIFGHEFARKFFIHARIPFSWMNSYAKFIREIRTNLRKFVGVFLHEKLVMLRMACTVHALTQMHQTARIMKMHGVCY